MPRFSMAKDVGGVVKDEGASHEQIGVTARNAGPASSQTSTFFSLPVAFDCRVGGMDGGHLSIMRSTRDTLFRRLSCFIPRRIHCGLCLDPEWVELPNLLLVH